MRVLAVDDDGDFLDLLQSYFLEAGIDLATCTSGPRALAMLEEQAFDVVMVDLVMPVMSGRALARHIRGRPRHADLPIVMMTQMSNVPFITAATPGDANHFVNKGGEPSWLIHFVTDLAGRRVS
jgi:two-component system cell cycle response regulator